MWYHTETWVHGYIDTRIQEYKDARIQGYKDIRIQGYKDTRIQGYKDTRIKEFKDTVPDIACISCRAGYITTEKSGRTKARELFEEMLRFLSYTTLTQGYSIYSLNSSSCVEHCTDYEEISS